MKSLPAPGRATGLDADLRRVIQAAIPFPADARGFQSGLKAIGRRPPRRDTLSPAGRAVVECAARMRAHFEALRA